MNPVLQKLIDDLLKIYPGSNIWLVGHSLGGSLASHLGATYGLPAVAFEAPGERLAASRLHLPLPPPISFPPISPVPTSISQIHLPHVGSLFPPHKHPQPSIPVPSPPSPYPPPPPTHQHIATTHVYHTADPIPQGACTGFGSPCSQAGFALETRCHLGESIVFDTVKKLGWSVDVRKHVIKEVVMNVLEADAWWGEEDDQSEVDESGVRRLLGWGKKGKKGEDEEEKKKRREGKRNVPKAIIEDDCVVSLA